MDAKTKQLLCPRCGRPMYTSLGGIRRHCNTEAVKCLSDTKDEKKK